MNKLQLPAATCLVTLMIFVTITGISCAQQQEMNPEDTEVWEPVPPKVEPGTLNSMPPPSDAVVLFDGGNFDNWETMDGEEPGWKISGNSMTVAGGTGSIRTEQEFGSVQLHLEWRTPEEIDGEGQGRGNSGVFLQGKYEVQVLDSYDNETYVNGMAGSIYKQYIPLVNAARPPGVWQSYDIIYSAPVFDDNDNLQSPAQVSVFWNGILVQHNVELKGSTVFIGHPEYEVHPEKAPLQLQDHGDAVSYRNIWIREL